MKFVAYVHALSLLVVTACSMLLVLFTDVFALKIITGVAVLFLIVVLCIRTSGFLRIVFSLFIVISFVLSGVYGISLENMLNSLNSHTIFIALFVCTPLIKFPIDAGQYLEKIIPLIKEMPRRLLSPMTIIVNFVLGSFLNLAGMRITDQFFSDSAKESRLLYGRMLSRSFSLAAAWTPYFAAFSVAVSYSNGNSAYIIGIGLLFSLSVITIWTLSFLTEKKDTGFYNPFSKFDLLNIGKVLTFFIFLVLSVAVFSHLFINLNVIFIISILSIFYSLLWSMMLRKLGYFFKALKTFISTDLQSIREEAYLFVATGFFANTLLQIGWKVPLPNLNGGTPLAVFLFVIFFNVIVVTIALFGIHHLVTITLITAAVDWQGFGIVPVVYGMTILLAWCLSAMISPFSPPNMIASRIVNENSFRIGPLSNGLFGLYVLAGGAVYLTITNEFFSRLAN